MDPQDINYHSLPEPKGTRLSEEDIEYGFIGTLQKLKYEYRPDIRDRAALEANFRAKFEALNRVYLTDYEFARLMTEIISPDVFTRDDGTPLHYTLVNIKDWCKNTYEVINQLRIANYLTSLDDLITDQSVKLQALKTHKKGLMQQLFPSPEEMAG